MGSKNHQPVIFQQPAEKHHPTTTPIYFLTGMNVDNNNKIKKWPLWVIDWDYNDT